MAFMKDVLVDAAVVAAGSTQADALELKTNVAIPTAASTDGTKGVKLPPNAAAGAVVVVRNVAAVNALKIYSNVSTGFINGTAGSTAYSLAATKGAMFVCVGADTWHAILSA